MKLRNTLLAWASAALAAATPAFAAGATDGHHHDHGNATIGEAEELNDAGTADLFTEILRGIDKWLWFVEAHAQAAT